jgi:protein-S-isoprenylcysteine O-methyltransferase Ste14
MHKRNNKGRLKMNIKLKAMLYTAAILLGFVGVSYLVVTITTMYPLVAAGILIVIAAATLIALMYALMYQIILESLKEK